MDFSMRAISYFIIFKTYLNIYFIFVNIENIPIPTTKNKHLLFHEIQLFKIGFRIYCNVLYHITNVLHNKCYLGVQDPQN